ncbi:hypothetical protein [Alkalihalobacillus sp. LMS39]|uniref:hypothetical protein n=1 Tax=Alkalihalobacillus sp. LMS39 TaxID=2924032 RepID=UPI001FB412FC|nr:hypothetical protein [Alkalihalobacillus sp. LMS39]UOE95185.1 hypothetical protein MM271_06050 [Alkalihalobacillus sp. LMS39]
MDTAIYFSLSFVYAGLVVYGIYAAVKERWRLFSIFLLIVTAALLYDNSVLAVGRYVGEGRRLELFNALRYWMHAFFTPLLILFAWQTVRAAGISLAKKWVPTFLVVVLTAVIIVMDAIPLFHLSLNPVWQHGVLSYKRVSDSAGPFMIMAVTFFIFVASIIIWRKQRWIWLFVGLIGMGVVGLLSMPFDSKAVGNVSELMLIISLFATQVFQSNSDKYSLTGERKARGRYL